MGKTYTVQVLNDKEFDSLPYDGIKDSLGFADVKKGMAFVRNTGSKEFDLGTVAHEVNHLIENHGKDHPDWENGILHKKGGFFRQIAAPLAGILGTLVGGPGLGALLGGLAGGATNTYAQTQHPEQLGKASFGSFLGNSGIGALEGFGAGSALTGGIAGGTAAHAGFLSKAAGIGTGALVGTAPSASVSGSSGLLGSGGKLLGIGAGSLAPTSLATSPALSALSSSVPAAGEAAARAATTGLQFSATPQVGLNLLGQVGATNALNSSAAANNPAMSLTSGGVGNSAGQSLNANTPAMSLTNGGIGNAAGNPIIPSMSPATPAMPGLGAGNTTGLGTSAGSAITPATGLGTSAAPAVAAKAPFSFKDLLTSSNVLGGGALLGSMAQQSPQFQMPDSVEELRQKIQAGNGLSPLGQQAQSSLQEILASQPSQINAPANDAYYADTNRRIDQQYTQAKAQLDAAYNNAGQLGSGEYMDQVRKLSQAQADAKDAFVQSENQRRFEFGSNQKYSAIQQALGVDQKTMDDLVGLTGLDVQTAAMMYGAQAADVTAIRQSLGTLGAQALLQGQGIKTQPNVTVSLGK